MEIELALVLCAAGGMVSGLLAGLFGIGGGLVVMPLLYACLPALGIDGAAVPRVAVATALAAMLPTSLSATLSQHRRGAIDWRWISRMAPAALLGTAAGALAATQLRGNTLSLLFAAYVCWCGASMLLPAARLSPARPVAARTPVAPPAAMSDAALALLVGTLGAGAGLGGGLVVVPYLLRRGVQMKHAVANSTVLNLLISAGGVLALSLLSALSASSASLATSATHGAHGPAQWLLAGSIGVGAVAGAPCGVAWSHRLPVERLRCCFGLVTLLAGASMLLGLGRA